MSEWIRFDQLRPERGLRVEVIMADDTDPDGWAMFEGTVHHGLDRTLVLTDRFEQTHIPGFPPPMRVDDLACWWRPVDDRS